MDAKEKKIVQAIRNSTHGYKSKLITIKKRFEDFPGGAVVKNPPAYAGDTGPSPGLGRSHMSWSN